MAHDVRMECCRKRRRRDAVFVSLGERMSISLTNTVHLSDHLAFGPGNFLSLQIVYKGSCLLPLITIIETPQDKAQGVV